MDDEAALQFLYNQAVADVANDKIDAEEKSSQLRMLKAQKKEREVSTDTSSILLPLFSLFLFLLSPFFSDFSLCSRSVCRTRSDIVWLQHN